MKRLYRIFRPMLFSLDPERAHDFSLNNLNRLYHSPFRFIIKQKPISDPYEVCGIEFANRVGLAAGLDKNARYLDALGALGFGFVEIGTVTPKPQPGNEKPRMFRLTQSEAIINRMGFNNDGVDQVVDNIAKSEYSGVLGINIGKNKNTPEEYATDDYVACMRKVYDHADYITVNISSPNTPGLRSLQFGERLDYLVKTVKSEQTELQKQFKKQVPVFVKIAPDLSESEVAQLADCFKRFDVDGIIATNTTLDRTSVKNEPYASEAGGLSGRVLASQSTRVLSLFNQELKGTIPLIGVGGICDSRTATEKIDAGASLVQLYTGFIYHGPKLIEEAASAIKAMRQ